MCGHISTKLLTLPLKLKYFLQQNLYLLFRKNNHVTHFDDCKSFVHLHELSMRFGVVLSVSIWTVATDGAGNACSSEVCEFMLVNHYFIFFAVLCGLLYFRLFFVILAIVLADLRFTVFN